jgi:hypothetical protein
MKGVFRRCFTGGYRSKGGDAMSDEDELGPSCRVESDSEKWWRRGLVVVGIGEIWRAVAKKELLGPR